ncbi:MAG: class I SAM-dependent methyltransferase [Hyphomicrobium sp.]|uniref:O-methyltransferase n=1 Tax=Hyphomicrobium sp. TaxID=82 RepID=UPI0039E44014
MNDQSPLNSQPERLRDRRPSPSLNPFGPIRDPKVRAVIETMNGNRRFPQRVESNRQQGYKAEDFADYGFSIHPDQGDLIYLLCRQMSARRVVDFATSVGMSAIYFAAAMRDNGGGEVIGSELVAAKAETAYRNLDAAGLKKFVDIRVGDARQTLHDIGGLADFVLIDGWPAPSGPSLAREVIEIVAPQLRVGGYVINDNAEPDFLEFIRDPANGFISMTLPIKRGTELAVKIS